MVLGSWGILSRSITGSPAKHPWQLYNTNTLDVSKTSTGRTEIFHCWSRSLHLHAYLNIIMPHWSWSVAYWNIYHHPYQECIITGRARACNSQQVSAKVRVEIHLLYFIVILSWLLPSFWADTAWTQWSEIVQDDCAKLKYCVQNQHVAIAKQLVVN